MTYRLEPTADGGTRVRFEIVTETMPAYERVVAPLLNAYIRRQNARAMERLKAQVEGAKAAA